MCVYMSAGPGEVFVTVHQAESWGLQSPFGAFISPQALVSLRLILGCALSHTNHAKLSHPMPGCGRKSMQTVPVPARGVSCLSLGEASCLLTSPWPGIKILSQIKAQARPMLWHVVEVWEPRLCPCEFSIFLSWPVMISLDGRI